MQHEAAVKLELHNKKVIDDDFLGDVKVNIGNIFLTTGHILLIDAQGTHKTADLHILCLPSGGEWLLISFVFFFHADAFFCTHTSEYACVLTCGKECCHPNCTFSLNAADVSSSGCHGLSPDIFMLKIFHLAENVLTFSSIKTSA